MKLIIAIIHEKDQRYLQDALLEHNFQFTNVSSTGGFLREGNVTLMIGVDDEQVEDVMNIFRYNCSSREQYLNMMPTLDPSGGVMPSPVKVVVGGAILFVVDVERFEKI